MLSQKFKIAIKLANRPAYQIAQQAGVNPATLSKLMCGISKVKVGDARIAAVAKILGIPAAECFEEDQTNVG